MVYQEGWDRERLFRPHPEERALARVSKDEGGPSFETRPFRPLLRMRVCRRYALLTIAQRRMNVPSNPLKQARA